MDYHLVERERERESDLHHFNFVAAVGYFSTRVKRLPGLMRNKCINDQAPLVLVPLTIENGIF
jgi:hypothetical protein